VIGGSCNTCDWGCVTEWRRCIGCPVFLGHFLQNCRIFSSSLAERDLQLKTYYACLPHCIRMEGGEAHVNTSHVKESCHTYGGLLYEYTCNGRTYACTHEHTADTNTSMDYRMHTKECCHTRGGFALHE